MVPYSLKWCLAGVTDRYEAEQHRFIGKSTRVTLEFRDDKLFEVKLSYAYGRRAKKIKKIIEEMTEVFGPVSKTVGPVSDDFVYEHLYYSWQTGSTMLKIDFRMSANVVDWVTIYVRSMEI